MPSPASGAGPDDTAPSNPFQRLAQAIVRPPASKPVPENIDFSRMSDEEKRAYIRGIDPSERKIGLIASGLGVVLALYANVVPMVTKVWVPTTSKPKAKSCLTGLRYVAKTKTCNALYPPSHYVLPLVVSLVLALAIYVTVRIRRRAPLAFAMVMTGLAFGTLLILVPYGVAAGWVMLRAWRTQKYGAPTAKSPVPGWAAPPPGTSRRGSGAGARARKGQDTTASVRKPPEANKRYTPKTPPKKKVAPPKS